MQPSTSNALAERPSDIRDVIVIGAGFGGIGAVIALRARGIDDVVVLEKSDALGGTWRDNTYPGCACDVPSPLYSFSFAQNPNWTRFYAGNAEILRYMRTVASDHDVVKHIRFNTRVVAARWHDDRNLWEVETTSGIHRARMVIAATGPLSEPAIPAFPGIERFSGHVFHSATWDHDHDLTGRRVAVVGTGASAVQFIPEIQPKVERLVVFQRTPQWVLAKPDKPINERERRIYRRLPIAQRAVRAITHLVFEATTIGTRHSWMLLPMRAAGRRQLKRLVKDPELRRRLTPNFDLGCKRILLSNYWYPAITAPNVVIASSGVREVTETGLVDEQGVHHEVDTLILATGFQAAEPPVAELFFDAADRSMKERFRTHGAQANLGTSVAGFPNLFLLTGPNTFVYGSIVGVIEAQLTFIGDAISTAHRLRLSRLDVREDVITRYNDEVQLALSGSVWNSGCASYFQDARGRITTMWPWSQAEMSRRMSRFDANDYQLKAQTSDQRDVVAR